MPKYIVGGSPLVIDGTRHNPGDTVTLKLDPDTERRYLRAGNLTRVVVSRKRKKGSSS